MEWRDVPGYEGYYEANELGEIRGFKKKNIIIGSIGKNGYRKFIACKDTIKRTLLFHRIIAKTFIANPDKLPIVNHKNCNKLDNSVNNLEWCTDEYNRAHAKINGRMKLHPEHIKKMHEAAWKSCYKPVRVWNCNNEIIGDFESCTDAAKHINSNVFNVSKCARGVSKTVNGYKVKFIKEVV